MNIASATVVRQVEIFGLQEFSQQSAKLYICVRNLKQRRQVMEFIISFFIQW